MLCDLVAERGDLGGKLWFAVGTKPVEPVFAKSELDQQPQAPGLLPVLPVVQQWRAPPALDQRVVFGGRQERPDFTT